MAGLSFNVSTRATDPPTAFEISESVPSELRQESAAEYQPEVLKNQEPSRAFTVRSGHLVLQDWKSAGQFRGYLHINDAPFTIPPQLFIVSSSGERDTLESLPTDQWPQIRIVLSRTASGDPSVESFQLRPSDNTVEAEILYTRVLYTLSEYGTCFLASEVTSDNQAVGVGFYNQPFSDETSRWLLHRAKIARKLKFLENLYNISFTLPEDITSNQVRRLETVFRGITEGEFSMRAKDVAVLVRAADVNLSEPPFSGMGSYIHYLNTQEEVMGHPQLLDVGPVYFLLNNAVVANQMVLPQLCKGMDQHVRFEVLDYQLTYRFERYLDPQRHKRLLRRLNQFHSELLNNEPEELADTLTEWLMADVPPQQASEIAVGWLEYKNFRDRFSPQAPVLDEERGVWRVPIYLVFTSGKGGPVGELLIDLKTGMVVEELSAELMRNEGHSLAENVLRVG